MVFNSISVEILDHIGYGYVKVFIEGYVVIVGYTDGDGVINIVRLVVERLFDYFKVPLASNIEEMITKGLLFL